MTTIRLRLSARSGSLLGGIEAAGYGINASSAEIVTASGDRVATLLGSSLRGVLRDGFRRFSEARTGEACSLRSDCRCAACSLFGGPDRAGSIEVRSAFAAPAAGGVRSGVSIDRQRRTADRAGRRLWTEQRSHADFEAELRVSAAAPAEHGELFELYLGFVEATGLHLGRRRSAGAGEIAVTRVLGDESEARPHGQLPGADTARTPWLLEIEALEPLRIAGRAQRAFFRETLGVIPASMLRGALGGALLRELGMDAAEDLVTVRPALVSTAVPVVADELPPGAWSGTVRCRGEAPHVIDLTARIVRRALGHDVDLTTCPRCGAGLKAHRPPAPPTLVLGQTAIDPRRRRAADEQLRGQVVVAPGARFRARLDATADQAAALAALGTIQVGGNRTRGLGLAHLSVDPWPTPPPAAARVATSSRAIGAEVAVLGLVSDAAPSEPVATMLTSRGLEIVTARVRTTVRGGWDEVRRELRPVRRLLAAGSWVAVRGPGLVEAAAALEANPAPDPEGTDPVWLTVRELEG